VVELEPRVVDVARDCAPVNQHVLDNPKVRLLLGDAREVLLVSREAYDLIVSQPSNPYRAGIASLFTREYYQAVRQRLAPGGLFVQWVQAYEVDGRTLSTVYATLGSVFPQVETWQVSQGDLLLVAGLEPRRIDADALRARLAREPFRSGLRAAWELDGLEDFLGAFVARASFARAVVERERGPLNSDDQNFVEFGFARTVGRRGLLSINDLRDAARLRGEGQPEVTGAVDPARLHAARVLFQVREGLAGEARARLQPAERALAEALEGHVTGDVTRVAQVFAALGREPKNLHERVALAEAWVELDDPRAGTALDALHAEAPLPADALRARLAAVRGQATESLAAAIAVLDTARRDPWLEPQQLERLLLTVQRLLGARPELAPQAAQALRAPLLLRAQEATRLNTLGEALRRSEVRGLCSQVLEELEPDVPWTRGWLGLRMDCYARDGRPIEPARSDLARFMAGEGLPFARDLAEGDASR
jgi:hypothetical protein